MLPESTRYSSDFIVAHRVPRDLPSSCVVDLGNNLGVLSPSYLLVKAPRKTDPIALALAMFEALRHIRRLSDERAHGLCF